MENFELTVNDRDYVETVYMNKEFSYDLFKNNPKKFNIEVNKNNVTFIDQNKETFKGEIIYQSYDEWVDDTDNLITLHNLDDEDLLEDEKQFIYFIEATIQLFYDLSADATWPEKWWTNIDLKKIVNYDEKEDDNDSLSTIDKLKKLFKIN